MNKVKYRVIGQKRSGVTAFIPIFFGFTVVIWGFWFFGQEQSLTNRISVLGNAKEVQSMIAWRASKLYNKKLDEELLKGTEEEEAKKIANITANKFTHDLMLANKIDTE